MQVVNGPFSSSQSESKCETIHMKMSSACRFIFMQIKVIFIRMVSHLDSLWNRGTRELGIGLLLLDTEINTVLKIMKLSQLPLWNCEETSKNRCFYFLVIINLSVISFQGNVTSFYDEYGNVSRVVGVYESANGIIMKLDSLLTPPMPSASRPGVCN